jgi:hypothetical protein
VPNEPNALQNIPISTTVDGVELRGEIVIVGRSDMIATLIAPVSGLRCAVHVPHFAMPSRALATPAGAVTPHGRQTAEWLLREAFEYSRGKPGGWNVEVLSPGGWQPAADQDDR